jgi:hypothetical protein
MDPPPWWYYVRRSVAAARLKAGAYAEAKSAAQASLAVWPDDALALLVLARAEDKLGDKADARRDLVDARKAWHGGDVETVPLDLI